jgi:polyphosphate kinase
MSDPIPRFINRELSWLEFNRRVLDEARDPGNPPLERLKYLAITGSNLDEFFMVRVGGLQLLANHPRADALPPDPAGLTIARQMGAVGTQVRLLSDLQYDTLRGLVAELDGAGIRCRAMSALTTAQAEYAEVVFTREIFPMLTPLAVPTPEDFPPTPGLGLNLLVRLAPEKRGRRDRFAVISIPRSIQRLVSLPTTEGLDYLMVEDLISAHLAQLFPGERLCESVVFRVIRNADMEVREDQAGDLLVKMRRVLQKRQEGQCVRLEIGAPCSASARDFLVKGLGAPEGFVFEVEGPTGLSGLMALALVPRFDALRFEQWEPLPEPTLTPGESLFEVLARRDLLFQHPYDRFDPVLSLIQEAADDPQVLSIKQILYRTSRKSPVVAALVRAAEKGKQVTVIVELKARFDEERNIEGARALERAGAQVIYGIRDLKTHAKLCLIVRREPTGVRRYLHFGTGNYNEITARLYTDISYLTANEDLATDASLFFNTITGYSQPVRYRKIEAAPIGLRNRILELIEGETLRARQGQEARILAKLNALVDPQIIEALYEASAAGVTVRLNVRGICCLRAGVPGLSGNIAVISIIDRFLEHGRILYFHRGGEPQVFITSADWMPRNLDRRIELLVPVEEPACRDRLIRILETGWADNVKARRLCPDGRYELWRPGDGETPLRSQSWFYEEAQQRTKRAVMIRRQEFEPHRPASGEK